MNAERLKAAAAVMALVPTDSTRHMTADERRAGVETMLQDLQRLAAADGCIAAAWALEKLLAIHPADSVPVWAPAEYRSADDDRMEVRRLRRMLEALTQTDDRTVVLIDFHVNNTAELSVVFTAPTRESEAGIAEEVVKRLGTMLADYTK